MNTLGLLVFATVMVNLGKALILGLLLLLLLVYCDGIDLPLAQTS
jgi:hypothetical protein